MADRFGIDIGLMFDSNGNAENNLKSTLNRIQKNQKLNVDLEFNNASLQGFDEVIKKMKEISSTTILDSNKFPEKIVTRYKDEMGKLIDVVRRYSVTQGQMVIDSYKVVDAAEKEMDALNKLKNTMHTKVSKLFEGDIIPKDSLLDIEKQISSINALTSKTDIDKINKAIESMVDSEKKYIAAIKEENKERAASIIQGLKHQETIGKLNNTLSKVDVKFQGNEAFKNLQKEINNLKTDTPQLEIDELKSKINELVSKGSEISKLQNALQIKLDKASANNLIDDSVIRSLQTRLNSINTDTATKEIEELKRSISNLNSTDNGIIRLQNAISKYKDTIKSLQNKYEIIPEKDLKSAQGEINKLNALLEILKKNTNNVSNQQISNQINSSASAMRNLNIAVKEANESNATFAEGIKDVASKFGLWVSLSTIVNKLGNELRKACDYVLEVDKRLTNVQMITGRSSNSVQQITEDFKNLGAELHTTNSEMLGGLEEVLRAGYDVETSKKMMESALIGAKLSGQTTEVVTQQLIAMKNAFDMQGDDIINVIDVISKLDNSSATSFKEIAEAIRHTAYSAQLAGTSFNDLTAYITTVSEKTRKEASVIGESFKTIYARYSNIKLGNVDEDGKSINDVEKALGRLGIKIRDTSGGFRDFDDVLKEFAKKSKSISKIDLLAGVNALAGTHHKETLLSLIENFEAFEQHQKNITEASGSAKKMFEEAYSESLDAKVQDLTRTFENLYETLINSSDLGNGIETFTSFIETINSLVTKFGLLPSIITTVGTITLATSKRFGAYLTDIKDIKNAMVSGNTTLGAEMKKAFGVVERDGSNAISKVKLLGVTFDVARLKAIAMQTALSLGLSIAISSVVTFISKMANANEELQSFNKEYADAMNNEGTDYQSIEKLIEKYEKLQGELSKIKLGTKEYKLKEAELLNVQEQLVQLYPQASKAIEDNMGSKRLNLDATKELIEADKILAKSQANAVLTKNRVNDKDDVDKIIGKYERYKNYMETFNKYKDEGFNGNVMYEGYSTDVDVALSKATEKYKEYKNTLEALLPAFKIVEDSNSNLKGSYEQIAQVLGIVTEKIRENTQVFSENNDVFLQGISDKLKPSKEYTVDVSTGKPIEIEFQPALNEAELLELVERFPDSKEVFIYGNSNDILEEIQRIQNLDVELDVEITPDGLEILESKLKSIGLTTKEITDRVEEFNKALKDGQEPAEALSQAFGKVYSDSVSDMESLLSIQKELNERQKLTPQITQDIINKYPHLIQYLTDSKTLQSALNDEITKQETIAQQSYVAMMEYSETYYNQNIRNSNEWLKAQETVYNSLISMHTQMLNSNIKGYSGYFNTIADGLKNDLKNAKSLAEAKVIVEKRCAETLSNIWSEYYSVVAKQAGQTTIVSGMAAYDEFSDEAGRISQAMYKRYSSIAKQAEAAKNAFASLNTSIGSIYANINGVAANISNPSSVTAGNIKNPSSTTSSGSKKEVEDIESIIDIYYKYEDALKKIENQLEKVRLEKELLHGKDKVNKINEEIELIKRQEQAYKSLYEMQKKEKAELEKILTGNGFKISNDIITNYAEQLTKLQNSANNEKNATKKEQKIEIIKQLESQIDRYRDLVDDVLGETEREILNSQLSLKDLYKEQLSLFEDVQSEIAKILKKNVEQRIEQVNKEKDAVIKSLNEQKDAYNKELKNEEYEDSLRNEQKKLDEIKQAMISAQRDLSLEGQLRLQQLQKEYDIQQKAIEDMIKQHEQDKVNEGFDDEISNVEDSYSKLIKNIEDMWTETKIFEMAQEALQDGFITLIDGSIVGIRESFVEFENTFGNGLTLIGDSIKSEFIDNLTQVEDILKNINNISSNLNIGSNFNSSNIFNKNIEVPSLAYDIPTNQLTNSRSGVGKGEIKIEFKEPLLVIQGNVDSNNVIKELEEYGVKLQQNIFKILQEQLQSAGIY